MTEPWWVSVIQSVIIINLVLVLFAYLTLAERKVMGRMQLRYGPNRAGPFGLLQPIADMVKLIRKESFFPGSAVERVPELQFQRPEPVIELAAADAERRQIASGETVSVRSNGTSVELRARVRRDLAAGIVRIAEEHAADLHRDVEVVKA